MTYRDTYRDSPNKLHESKIAKVLSRFKSVNLSVSVQNNRRPDMLNSNTVELSDNLVRPSDLSYQKIKPPF